MARFERPRGKGRSKRDSNSDFSREDSGNRGRFEDNFRGRRNDRDSGRDRRSNLKMTKVTCDSCGDECEVPFKPTSSKPVYCRDCFEKKGGKRGSSNGPSRDSSKDLEIINDKLDKIMKALKIK